MTIRKQLLARTAAATTTLGVALAGTVMTTAAPADALSETDYGFQTLAYGSTVVSGLVGLSSERTAYSYIACTRIAGLKRENMAADVSLPSDNPAIFISGIKSNTRTFKNKANDIAAASRGKNTIATVRIGSAGTPVLTIKALSATSTAWADNSGDLHAKNDFTSAKITLVNLPEEIPAELAGPLQDLLDALNGGLEQVIAALQDNLGNIVIPGLGEIALGYDKTNVIAGRATARANALKVLLYGPDTLKGGGDDTAVRVGHSLSRVSKNVPAGVMTGKGYGAEVSLLDDVVGVGRLGVQPLPCEGTRGKIKDNPTAGLNLGGANALVLGAVNGRVFGEQSQTGSAKAWTEGSIASIGLGPLEIRGIFGRANVRQNKAGEIVRKDIKGSSIAEILVDGESMGGFNPETAGDIPPIEVPGVATIEFFKTEKTKRGLITSAVVITLLEDTPGTSVIRLGNARVFLQKR